MSASEASAFAFASLTERLNLMPHTPAAISGNAVVKKPAAAVAAGALRWLIDQYRDTAAWQRDLSNATRRQRDNIYRQVIATSGNASYTLITKADIERGRERRGDTPHQARHFLDAMRGLFRWATKQGHIKTDPTAGVDDPARPDSEGFKPWNDDDVIAYEKQWPIGTRQRVWLDVMLYTGLRRGDAVRIGKQHVRHGTATLVTEKTGTEVSLPILPVLQRTLDTGPCGDLAKNRSAINLEKRAKRLASANQLTDCARSPPRAAPRMAQRCHR